jgi:pimeloyl-ACP methyl ester carboxylesterase
MSRRAFLPLLACAILIAVQGCAKKDPLSPDSLAARQQSLSARSSFDPAGPPPTFGAFEIRGEIGPGVEYALLRPEDWNGDLVVYAHGYIPTSEPVGLDAVEALGEHLVELRNLLLERGYAVAYSSYSANGFAVKEGAHWTDRVREIFASKVGTPERTFVIGQSLGALVAVMLVEKFPEVYAGALPIAGILGGSRAAIDYYANVRVLFDYFYPDVLPGSLLDLPDGIDVVEDVRNVALAAMFEHPEGAFAIAQIDQAPLPYRTPEELFRSILVALEFHAIALEDLLDRTHGQSFFDNSGTVYTSSTLPPALLEDLNAKVARYSIAPSARAYFDRYYEPMGRLSIPVLTLHMRWDPVAPIFHEDLYEDRVAAAGSLSFLERRTIEAYGHPSVPPLGQEITASEIASAFDDLVARAAARAPAGSRVRASAGAGPFSTTAAGN